VYVLSSFLDVLCSINLKFYSMKNVVMIIAAVGVLSLSSCKNTDKQGVIADDSQKGTIDSMKQVAEKQHIIDSMKLVNEKAKPVVINQTTTTQTTTTHKKWSGAAKGAVIGAGVGAITGALVDKKHGEGAIIGGLAGAGLGAGTGAIIDGKKKK
jgi:hypothetical protein